MDSRVTRRQILWDFGQARRWRGRAGHAPEVGCAPWWRAKMRRSDNLLRAQIADTAKRAVRAFRTSTACVQARVCGPG